MTAPTIPCRQDPGGWDLPTGGITLLTPASGQHAVNAVNACLTCPFKASGECATWRPADDAPYLDRCVQDGEIWEPGVGWLDLDTWLRRAGLRRCTWCSALTRAGLFCGIGCRRIYQRRLRADAAGGEVVCEASYHDTAWAFTKHNCKHPAARLAYIESLQRTADRRQKPSSTPRTEVATPAQTEQKPSRIAAMAAQGMSTERIGNCLGMHPDSVSRHLRRAKQQAEPAGAVA